MHIEGFLSSLPWLVICLALILRFRSFLAPQVPAVLLISVFLMKMGATFFLQWLYTHYYPDRSTGDIFRYFDDGLVLHSIFSESPADFFKIMTGWYPDDTAFKWRYLDRMNTWIKPYDVGFYNDNQVMVRINALFTFLSGGVYEVHSVLFSSLALSGTLLCARFFVQNPMQQAFGMLLISLYPGYLLWTSGGLKESLVVTGLGLVFFSVLKRTGQRPSPVFRWLWAALGMFILLSVKLYLLAALLPAMLVRDIDLKWHWKWPMLWLTWAALIAIGLSLTYAIGIDVGGEIVHKQSDFIRHSALTNPGSAIPITAMDDSWFSLLRNLPEAIFNASVRPLPWQCASAAEWLMLAENLYLLLLVITAIIAYFRRDLSPGAATGLRLALMVALPILALIGWTTPVLGAIMRYRAPVIILLIAAIASYSFRKTTAHDAH